MYVYLCVHIETKEIKFFYEDLQARDFSRGPKDHPWYYVGPLNLTDSVLFPV